MTETLTELPELEWYPEEGTHVLGEGTREGTVMTVEAAAKVIEKWAPYRRRAIIIDPYTIEARSMNGSGSRTLYLGRLPQLSDRHQAVKAVLDGWADAPMSVTQHEILGVVLRAHADGLPVGQILDRLIATGVR